MRGGAPESRETYPGVSSEGVGVNPSPHTDPTPLTARTAVGDRVTPESCDGTPPNLDPPPRSVRFSLPDQGKRARVRQEQASLSGLGAPWHPVGGSGPLSALQ